VMMFEMVTLAQRNEEIAAQLADLGRLLRTHIAEALREKAQSGALELRAGADTAASFLLALADGITLRVMTEPELDIAPLMAQSVIAARALLA
jgi:hypothetical protein